MYYYKWSWLTVAERSIALSDIQQSIVGCTSGHFPVCLRRETRWTYVARTWRPYACTAWEMCDTLALEWFPAVDVGACFPLCFFVERLSSTLSMLGSWEPLLMVAVDSGRPAWWDVVTVPCPDSDFTDTGRSWDRNYSNKELIVMVPISF